MTQTNETNSLDKREISSIKRQLESLPPFELVEFLESLLKQGKVQAELVESLVTATTRTQVIYPGLLARCIVATKSIIFFEACESKFENSPADLIPIFATFFSKAIEPRLCDYFYRELQSKDPFPYFDTCLDALTKNGRKLTLDTLEVLDYEYGPKADLAKVIFAAIQGGRDGEPLQLNEYLQSLTENLTIHRLSEIRRAITILQTNLQSTQTSDNLKIQTEPLADVKSLGASRDFEQVKVSSEEYARKAMERSEVHKENAEQLLTLKRYADAGNNYRKAAEAILKAVFVIRLQKTRVPTLLDHLKTNLKSSAGDLPLTISNAIDLVQNIGNVASHDQSDNHFEPNEKLMGAVQDALKTISNWARSVMKN